MRYQNSARCPECARLTAQRKELEQIYLAALGNLTAAAGARKAEYVTLRSEVDEAETGLNLVGAEILEHQSRHTWPH